MSYKVDIKIVEDWVDKFNKCTSSVASVNWCIAFVGTNQNRVIFGVFSEEIGSGTEQVPVYVDDYEDVDSDSFDYGGFFLDAAYTVIEKALPCAQPVKSSNLILEAISKISDYEPAEGYDLSEAGLKDTVYIIARSDVEFNTYTYQRDDAIYVHLSPSMWEHIASGAFEEPESQFHTWGALFTEEKKVDLSYMGRIRIIPGGIDSTVYHDILKLEAKDKINVDYYQELIV